MQKFLIKIRHFFLPVAFIFVATSFTGAYYSDRVSIANNSFAAGIWFPSEDTSPAADYDAKAGDVVINELMWPGSTASPDDEWIELRNMTNYSISLAGWQISKLTSSEAPMLTITGGTLPANGYFLISKFGKGHVSSALDTEGYISGNVGLRNSNLQIKLYKGSVDLANLIDTADDGLGNPLAGLDEGTVGPRKSMSRKLTPGDGTQASSWFTSSNNTTAYWDAEGDNYGTPGGSND